jgi:hypothetical protein
MTSLFWLGLARIASCLADYRHPTSADLSPGGHATFARTAPSRRLLKNPQAPRLRYRVADSTPPARKKPRPGFVPLASAGRCYQSPLGRKPLVSWWQPRLCVLFCTAASCLVKSIQHAFLVHCIGAAFFCRASILPLHNVERVPDFTENSRLAAQGYRLRN